MGKALYQSLVDYALWGGHIIKQTFPKLWNDFQRYLTSGVRVQGSIYILSKLLLPLANQIFWDSSRQYMAHLDAYRQLEFLWHDTYTALGLKLQ